MVKCPICNVNIGDDMGQLVMKHMDICKKDHMLKIENDKLRHALKNKNNFRSALSNRSSNDIKSRMKIITEELEKIKREKIKMKIKAENKLTIINMSNSYLYTDLSKRILDKSFNIDINLINTIDKFDNFLISIQFEDEAYLNKCINNEYTMQDRLSAYSLLSDVSIIVHNRLIEFDPDNDVIASAKDVIKECNNEIFDVD